MSGKVPKGLGFGEGGKNVPQLQGLLNAVAKDLEALFTAATVNQALRSIRGSDEVKVTVSGTLTDSVSADPIAFALVTISAEGDATIYYTAISDSEGKYAIDLYKGDYDITVEKSGYLLKEDSSVTVAANATKNYTVIPYLAVVESDPAEGDVDVAVDTTVVLTYDRAIKFADNEAAVIANVIIVDEDDTAYVISGAAVGGDGNVNLTLTIDGDLANDKLVTVVVPHDEDVVVGTDDAPMSVDFVLTFTTVAGGA